MESAMPLFLNDAVMNLPEPSGSSPAEKPPGIIMMFASRILAASSANDSLISFWFLFLITNTSASAPALSKALAESISQLLPGNTGMITFGLAPLRTPGAAFLGSPAV